MGESLAVTGHDLGPGAFCHGQLPGVIFAEALARGPGPALQAGALAGVLVAQGLGDESTDEG
jgi:hypothetical protein